MALRTPALFRATAIAAMLSVLVVIFYESSQSRGQPGIIDLSTNESYIGHFMIYAVAAFCAMTVLGRPTVIGLVTVFLLASGLGVAMEFYQIQVPTRTADATDAFADAAGALAGLVIYVTAAMLMEPPKKRQPSKL